MILLNSRCSYIGRRYKHWLPPGFGMYMTFFVNLLIILRHEHCIRSVKYLYTVLRNKFMQMNSGCYAIIHWC